MINYLRHMAVFARVVDEGSFRAAARDLGLAPSRVSQTVSDLEKYVGVTLFYRTTRKLSLSSEGRRFYEYAADMIRNAEAGLNQLNALSLEPVGELKVSLPAFLESSPFTAAIAEFVCLYPKINISIIYSDQVVDILDEGLDLSIRVGWLEDSSMMSRKLGKSNRLLVATNEYVDKHPTPKHPSDLKDWDWIRFQIWPRTIEFAASREEEVFSLPENSRITVNGAEALKFLARQSLGLTILPEHFVNNCIASGELVHVLPDWKLKPLGYYAVWPDKSRRENLTLLLVRFLAERELV